MTFEVPELEPVSSASLREIEQGAPKTTPAAIRNALARAAAELDAHERLERDVVLILEEALRLKVGQMDSHSRVQDVERAVKNAMMQAVARLQNGRTR